MQLEELTPEESGMKASARRVLLFSPLFATVERSGLWSFKWIANGTLFDERPRVVAYRLQFKMPFAGVVRVHVTAHERYELWLDGKRVGRGSKYGDRLNWFFESYDLSLRAGSHHSRHADAVVGCSRAYPIRTDDDPPWISTRRRRR